MGRGGTCLPARVGTRCLYSDLIAVTRRARAQCVHIPARIPKCVRTGTFCNYTSTCWLLFLCNAMQCNYNVTRRKITCISSMYKFLHLTIDLCINSLALYPDHVMMDPESIPGTQSAKMVVHPGWDISPGSCLSHTHNKTRDPGDIRQQSYLPHHHAPSCEYFSSVQFN